MDFDTGIYDPRHQLVEIGLKQGKSLADFDVNEAVNDAALLSIMVDTILEKVTMFSQGVLVDETIESDTDLPLTVYGEYSSEFDRMLTQTGLAVSDNSAAVPLSFASRYLTFDGIINRFHMPDDHSEPATIVLNSCVNAFDSSKCIILKPRANENAAREHDLSSSILTCHGGIRRHFYEDFEHMCEWEAPDYLIIDCFRDCSLGDVLDLYLDTVKESLSSDFRTVGFFSIPYSLELVGHLFRYIRSGRRLVGEDKTGQIPECGLRYAFEDEYVVFNDNVGVFQINIDNYMDMVYGTDFDTDVGHHRVVIEVFQSTFGILTRKMTVYESHFSDTRETEISLPTKLMGGFKIINGYSVDGGVVISQPYQVEEKLYDACLEAALTMEKLTPENVRNMVSARSQTITSVLGRTTQTIALSSPKFEALSQSVYMYAFEQMYAGTQILKADSAVQGLSLDQMGRKAKRSLLLFTALAVFFPVGSLLPQALVVKAFAGSALVSAVSLALSGTAASLIGLVSSALLTLQDWSSYTDIVLFGSHDFERRVDQFSLDSKRNSLAYGVSDRSYGKIVSDKTDFLTFSAGNFHYVLSSQGDYFDADGNKYALSPYAARSSEESRILFSAVRKTGMHFKLGDLWSSDRFSSMRLDGYLISADQYFAAKRLVAGFSFSVLPKEIACFSFFNLKTNELVYCDIHETHIDSQEDVPFLGLTALKGREDIRMEVSRLTLNLDRLKAYIRLKNPSVADYLPEGLLVGDSLEVDVPDSYREPGFVSSPHLRMNLVPDIAMDQELYANCLEDFAKSLSLNIYPDQHFLFVIALNNWYSRWSHPPFDGVKLGLVDGEVKANFEDCDLSQVIIVPNAFKRFEYLADDGDDFVDDDDDGDGPIADSFAFHSSALSTIAEETSILSDDG